MATAFNKLSKKHQKEALRLISAALNSAHARFGGNPDKYKSSDSFVKEVAREHVYEVNEDILRVDWEGSYKINQIY